MFKKIQIVILGGGTAGWMCAAALSRLAPNICSVRLVESDDISTVGVGEATLPQLKEFNDLIGINEADMMSKTAATFKLGIEFSNWGQRGNSYIHPFGAFGQSMGGVEFHQQWARANTGESLEAYSYAVQACRNHKFDFPVDSFGEVNSTYSYAYHFDAGLYAAYLRNIAEQAGVERIEGVVNSVSTHPDNGNIQSLMLASNQEIKGDYFIDCSGFRSLLLGQTLKVPFEDWSPWLVCDRAWAVASESGSALLPYTRSIAHEAGWQWRIPLQHRMGNGYVFSSQFISEDEAAACLLRNLEAPALSEPRLIRFKAGRYYSAWEKNCVAIGLSGGFLEPLESTSIYLIQVAITNLLKLFPKHKTDVTLSAEFNRLMDMEYSRIKDFLILHYHLNQRDDSELWRYCRSMPIPESLAQKIELFRWRGYVDSFSFGLFNLASWQAVYIGQGLSQTATDPFANNLPLSDARDRMDDLARRIQTRVNLMPSHRDFIADYCPFRK